MELKQYLERIGYSGPVEPTSAVLRDLHRQHMYSVPFENLDIPLGREIVLDAERIYQKIVTNRRGGFCYEQNAMFAWALREMGFDVDMLSAGVARPNGSYGPDFDHMLLLVRVDGESWIADVGFGESFVEPLRFAVGESQWDRGLEYEIARDGDAYVLRRKQGGNWKNQYRFTLTPRKLQDYAPMCMYHQTSPESHFTRNRVCSLATPSGRVTVMATALIVTENGVKTETPIASVAEFERRLREQFGMELSGFPPGVAAH
jgi:N-hydroxyarylamine O-acetyltransferase